MRRFLIPAVTALIACTLSGAPGPVLPIGQADSTATLLAVLDTVLQSEPSRTLTAGTPVCVEVLGGIDPDTRHFSHSPLAKSLPDLIPASAGFRVSEDCLLEMSTDTTPSVWLSLFPIAFYGHDSATTMVTMYRLPLPCSSGSICIPHNPSDAMLFIHLTFSREKWRADRITKPEALF